MIDSHIKMIVVISKRRRRDEILKRRVAIRLGIKRRDPSADRIDEEARDLISGERLLSKRIYRLSEKRRREITRALRKRGNVGDSSYAFTNASAFVIGKEEGPVFPVVNSGDVNRSAHGAPELVIAELRLGGGEEVARVQVFQRCHDIVRV